MANPATSGLNANQQFSLARAVVTAKWQQVVLTEFLPALGISQADVEQATPLDNRPDMSMEFSIAYRLGHDIIGDFVGSISIADAFNGEAFFTVQSGNPAAPTVEYKPDAEALLSSIFSGLVSTPCNEFDGRLSDALRNFLFGRAEGEDLAGRNIFRGRELGIPTYAGLAECFGIVPNLSVEAETPDAWLGLLREPKVPGTPLGPTRRAILVEQFHRSVFGRGGFYWRNSAASLGEFLPEVEASTYAQIIAANTGVAATGNVFRL
eukprot:jgi/Ulvmu1/31/UM001_0033.1